MGSDANEFNCTESLENWGALVSAPGQKDKFTPELRILVASLLSFGVIILWAKFFGPKPPILPPQVNRPARRAPATPGPATWRANAAAATMAAGSAGNGAATSDTQGGTSALEDKRKRETTDERD